MMRDGKNSDWNGKSGGRLDVARLALAVTAAFFSLSTFSALALAQELGPKPLRPLAPVLSEAVPPDQLADAIAPDVMRELNDATADELLSGGRAAFEDGRHQDAQIFFEHLISRFSRTEEAGIARRYLAALYATLPEPQRLRRLGAFARLRAKIGTANGSARRCLAGMFSGPRMTGACVRALRRARGIARAASQQPAGRQMLRAISALRRNIRIPLTNFSLNGCVSTSATGCFFPPAAPISVRGRAVF